MLPAIVRSGPAVYPMHDRKARCLGYRILQRVVDPHSPRYLENRDEREDERNANQREFDERTPSPAPGPVLHRYNCTLIWAVRVIVICPINPGIGNKGTV